MTNSLGIAIVLAILGGLLGSLRLYQKLGTPHAEMLRKCLHVGMGLVAISFPWLFDSAWPVLVLGALSLAGMAAMRLIKALSDSVGKVVGGVGRFSLGEIYFPVGIAVQWLLYLYATARSEYRVLLYCIPLLLLTLADAAAALVGVKYGSQKYETSDGMKSAEGSLAFFLCAFLCVYVPLLLESNTGGAKMLAIALLLALVAMLFEAIAWAGLDNLVLPLVGYLLLRIYLGLSLEELELRLAVAGGMMVFVLTCRTQTTLVGSALLGASLVGYLSWALGGWRWIIPPLTVFLGHTLLSPRTTANSQRIHNIHSVIAVSAAGLFWLFIFRLFDQPESAYFCLFDQPESAYFCLFTLSFAVQLGMIAVARLAYDYPRLPAVWLLGICVLQGWGLIMLPYLALALSEPHAIACVAWGLGGVALATVGFYFLQPNVRDCPADRPRWLRQAALGALGSAVGLVPLYLL
jgi:phytol kinase